MSDDTSVYFVVGLIPVSPGGPGFCTPAFRDDAGKKFFLQSMRHRRAIEAFTHVGDQISPSTFFSFRPNGEFRTGERPYTGFRFPDGSIIFEKRNIVHDLVISRIGELVDYPFIFFQVARLSRSPELIQYALGFTEIDEAVKNGWIKLKSSEPQFGWTYSNELTLRTMTSNGHSASAIARELGTSRNAVLSKIKRLRLKSRYDDRQQWLFDDFPTETDPSKWRISSPHVYSAAGVAIQRSGVYALPPTPPDASSFNKNQRSFLGPDDGNSED
ncbi:hypothetical protein N7379_02695 [Rhizobium pusense]|uniref:GcrA family cell cycle regulator n=1 Tax=Agrobacterium pusense TaxID=648995 RepID=UPI0024471515|nr:GcrA family cell cycle regulator [Agrobacterium pusense]MDH0113373.1 hypothetical protein [Agrobacterium pusense]